MQIGKDSALVSRQLNGNKSVWEAAESGHNFYLLDYGFMYWSNLSNILKAKIYGSYSHVDLFIGQTGNVLLSDQDFFSINSAILKRVLDRHGFKLVLVPREEERIYPSNFLVLESKLILMDRRAKKTAELLQNEGIKVIPTSTPLTANVFMSGGVRCFVNEIYY